MNSKSSILNSKLYEALASASDRAYLFVVDIDANECRWSKSTVDFFDLPDEFLPFTSTAWQDGIHPDDIDVFNEDFERILSGQSNTHHCQYRRLNKHGKYIWVECKGHVLREDKYGSNIFAGIITCLDNRNKYDALTGLYTSHEFYNRDLTNEYGYFMLIGIDNFKKVISSYGYSFADEVLVEFSRKLMKLSNDSSTVYRFGGDEFLLVFTGCEKEDIMHEFDNILYAADNLGAIRNKNISLSVSAGAVQFPMADSDIEEYINNLENSLDMAKTTRKGSIVFYSQEVADRQLRIRYLREDLKQSIKDNFNGFELFYQPLVNGQTCKIEGCEALLRWKGERIKDSYPGEFIKVLEDDGNIRLVGKFVMETAIRQLAEWEKKYGDIRVSFNISYQQFMEDGFVDNIIDVINDTKIDTSHLIAELTESCHVENPETLQVMFQRLKDRGVKIALDDFGTAYSSLELLKILPATHIKIEHSFVRELAEKGHDIDYIIIDNILSLCKKLNCSSVVEGVENAEVEKIIRAMNPTYMQGYHFSRPVCKEDFEKMLDKERGM